MNWKNEFQLEPGTYADEHDTVLVVYDIVNHRYNTTAGMLEHVSDPDVVARPLNTPKEYVRYSIPLSVFKSKFKKV